MKFKNNSKSVIIEIICLLYVLLFVYAAINKFLDFENFQVQLGQSPLLSAFAIWVSWLVPVIEIVIALALLIPGFRSVGLLAALGLMTMFSAYIFIILHYSSFVPCSCGGILEKMSWNMHLIFNLVFVVLAGWAIILNEQTYKNTISSIKLSSISRIMLTAVSGTVIMIILFISSEDIMQHKNPFIRRYPQHPITLKKSIDLKFNSYYFAGSSNHRIYLGNHTAPLHILAIGSDLQVKESIAITFDPKEIPFKMVRVVVRQPWFYLIDGSVPAVFKGKIKDWKITGELKDIPHFTLAEPIDSTSIIFRASNKKRASHVFGIYNQKRNPKDSYNPSLLKQQIDGIFDTDGILVYDENLQRTVYVYYYRNEFIVTDKDANLVYSGNTIDTTSKAKIKVAYLNKNSTRKMSAPPLVVNAHAAVCKNLLFIHSKIPGQFQDEQLWKSAFIIDVYDLKRHTYLMSFAIYKVGDKRLKSFHVTASHLYALMDNELVVYELRDILKKEMK